MTDLTAPEIDLRPWTWDDFGLMELLLGDPLMTEHLGGPEAPERMRRRLLGYMGVGDTSPGRMFVITVGPERAAAGSIGYWEMTEHGKTFWETGWSVLHAFQGQGVATGAAIRIARLAAEDGLHDSLHAFPLADNGPSNAVCRKAGFTLLGPCEFEYPPGNPVHGNDWVLALPTA